MINSVCVCVRNTGSVYFSQGSIQQGDKMGIQLACPSENAKGITPTITVVKSRVSLLFEILPVPEL